MGRALDCSRQRDGLTRLIGEQINGMTRVMPEQMIDPATRLAESVGIGAPEKERLRDQMLDTQLICCDFLM